MPRRSMYGGCPRDNGRAEVGQEARRRYTRGKTNYGDKRRTGRYYSADKTASRRRAYHDERHERSNQRSNQRRRGNSRPSRSTQGVNQRGDVARTRNRISWEWSSQSSCELGGSQSQGNQRTAQESEPQSRGRPTSDDGMLLDKTDVVMRGVCPGRNESQRGEEGSIKKDVFMQDVDSRRCDRDNHGSSVGSGEKRVHIQAVERRVTNKLAGIGAGDKWHQEKKATSDKQRGDHKSHRITPGTDQDGSRAQRVNETNKQQGRPLSAHKRKLSEAVCTEDHEKLQTNGDNCVTTCEGKAKKRRKKLTNDHQGDVCSLSQLLAVLNSSSRIIAWLYDAESSWYRLFARDRPFHSRAVLLAACDVHQGFAAQYIGGTDSKQGKGVIERANAVSWLLECRAKWNTIFHDKREFAARGIFEAAFGCVPHTLLAIMDATIVDDYEWVMKASEQISIELSNEIEQLG